MICYDCNPGGIKPPVSWGKMAYCPHGRLVFASSVPIVEESESTPEVEVSEPETTAPVEIKRSPGRPRKVG